MHTDRHTHKTKNYQLAAKRGKIPLLELPLWALRLRVHVRVRVCVCVRVCLCVCVVYF